MAMAICCVVAAYRQSPTRKYLLAWLSSEPGLSACGILYRTRGFPHSRSMRERNKQKERDLFRFLRLIENEGIKDRDRAVVSGAGGGRGVGDAEVVCAEAGGSLSREREREIDGGVFAE